MMAEDEKFFELLDAGYAPADAARMARKVLYGGQGIATYSGGGGQGEQMDPEKQAAIHETGEIMKERLRTPKEELAEFLDSRRRKEWHEMDAKTKAANAVGFAQRWKTWPPGGDFAAACKAAHEYLESNAFADKFDVAKAAVRAAGRRQQ